jgi:predicted DNA-binding ribbon-helix-helix protein
MKSPVVKRYVYFGSRRISMSVEDAFWEPFKEIAASQELTPGQLVGRIDKERTHPDLSSAIRLFVLDYYRRLAEEKIAVKQK